MDLNRLSSLLAVPLAGLFLILALCTFAVQRPEPMGMYLPLIQVRVIPYEECFDGLSDRDIVVGIQKDGSTWINETRVRSEDLGARLGDIYAFRKEKILYIFVDPEVSYGEFAEFYSKVASSTDNLHIGLITRGIRNQIDECPSGSGCTVNWPKEGGNYECKNPPPMFITPLHPAR